MERTTRGYSVDLLIVDEAAGVPDYDYYGLLPALVATRGEQVLLSTPRGKRGFFWEIWSSSPGFPGEEPRRGEDRRPDERSFAANVADDPHPDRRDRHDHHDDGRGDDPDERDWLRVMVRSDEVERIRPEDLEVFRAAMPEEFFRQEFYCEFLDTEGGLFAYDDIERALARGEQVEAIRMDGDDEW